MNPAATHERTKELRHEGNHVTFLNLYIDDINTCSVHTIIVIVVSSITVFLIAVIHRSCVSVVDIDECQRVRPVCPAAARCLNTVGSYVCQCGYGFYGNRRHLCKSKLRFTSWIYIWVWLPMCNFLYSGCNFIIVIDDFSAFTNNWITSSVEMWIKFVLVLGILINHSSFIVIIICHHHSSSSFVITIRHHNLSLVGGNCWGKQLDDLGPKTIGSCYMLRQGSQAVSSLWFCSATIFKAFLVFSSLLMCLETILGVAVVAGDMSIPW